MAALDVVHHRLRKAGLGSIWLELHSRTAGLRRTDRRRYPFPMLGAAPLQRNGTDSGRSGPPRSESSGEEPRDRSGCRRSAGRVPLSLPLVPHGPESPRCQRGRFLFARCPNAGSRAAA
jgi:hypothetical protein